MGIFSNFAKAFRLDTPIYPDATDQITMTEMDLSKSERAQSARAIVEDPFSIIQSLGYKDKPFSLTYETLKQMSIKNSVVASIVTTRVNQVSSFSKPARYTKDGVGFEITLRNPKKQPKPEQERLILALESFLENCGFSYDPSRDTFDALLRKLTRDSLVYDQACIEIVPDRMGRPAEFYAIDGSTIRAAAVEPEEGEQYVTSTSDDINTEVKWVQVVNGEITAEFSGDEMCFGVRNPRTDINIQPYGFSELEVLINQVTSHLWAEEYNSRYFSQGGTTKGILNLKGQNISKPQLDAFRRQWTAQVTGLTGAWKTPVVSVEGLEYINVSQSNREMEYEMWMNYLINICCAVYQIDPAEINFPNRGGSGGSGGGGLGEGGIEDRLKNSRDKGLRPLLRFIENLINRYIIRRFTDEFTFNFVGLDPETETDKLAVTEKEIKTFRTINEVRKLRDLDPIEDGDIVLDPTYTNYLLQKQQNDQMMQQGGMDGGDPSQGGDGGDQTAMYPGEDGQGEEVDDEEAQKQDEDNQISQSIDDQYNQ